MASYSVRQYGDPVLKQPARHVDQIDGNWRAWSTTWWRPCTTPWAPAWPPLRSVCKSACLSTTLATAPRSSSTRSSSRRRGSGTTTKAASRSRACGSDITRPDRVHLVGLDLDGEEVSIEADEFLGRVFQHEVDHLDGVLMVERLDPEQRKIALKVLRDRALGLDTAALEEKLVSADSDQVV